jgi:hypothetical protein
MMLFFVFAIIMPSTPANFYFFNGKAQSIGTYETQQTGALKGSL